MSRPSIHPLPVLLVLSAFALAGCDSLLGPGDGPRPPERISELPRTLSPLEMELITASNDFAFHFLRETLAREDEHPNVFLSPLSASMALGMTLNGADGETFEAMRATLGFSGMSQDEINEAYRDLMELLLGLDPGVEMLVANSAWAREGWPFLPSFFAAIQEWFDAQAQELDFDDPATLDAINGWAKEHTNGRIPLVLDEIAPEHVLFLLNAVYFNGDWTHQFDRGDTDPGAFTLADGSQVQVDRMNGKMAAGIRHLPDGPLVGELPYGGQAFVMNVVVPAPGSTLDELLADLDASSWQSWTQGFPEDYIDARKIQVGLPKLELSYGKNLNEVLDAMGMGIAFDEALADFSRMIDLPPSLNAYLDFVRQDTFLRVDEEGTEAAAVTTVGVGVDSAPPSLIVDRPYMLVIRERLSGTILFVGAIRDPRDGGG